VLFTGKQRDRETKLDLFGARVYSNSCFKWLSPDQPLLDNWISNPSSWNLYSYVRNNPLLLVDTTGKISVVFFDQSTRPDDKGKSGTSYGAKVFVVTSTNIYGPYRGSSYPNSNSRMINNTFYNTVKEGVYTFINRYGHKKGTQQGLNLVEFNSNNQQKRETPATTPDGMDTMATVINVHSGATDYGTERSRGSQGCLTIHPQDASSFFSNFSWFDGLGPIFSKGNDSGFLYLYRSDLDMTDQLNALQEIQMIEQEMSRYEQENK
jgi:RHS repeat-associated protein